MSHSVPAPPGRPRWQALFPFMLCIGCMFFTCHKRGSGISNLQERLLVILFAIFLLCFFELPVPSLTSWRKPGNVMCFHFLQVQAPWPHISGSPKKPGCLWKGSKVVLKSCEVRWQRAFWSISCPALSLEVERTPRF